MYSYIILTLNGTEMCSPNVNNRMDYLVITVTHIKWSVGGFFLT